ncbi:MAG: RNA polymerase sigma factor [Streptosporangiaceae bacterium]
MARRPAAHGAAGRGRGGRAAETFLAVWQGARSYRPDAAGAAWLWGIARRQAAQWLRRRGRAVELVAALAQAGAPAVTDPAEAALTRAELADAVEALGPPGAPEREVWRLVYVQDRPVAEVAELMGVPAGTVKSRAHRTRRLLRAAISSAAEPQPPGPAPRQRCPGSEDRLPMPAKRPRGRQ